MTINKIGGIYFWRIANIGGSVYIKPLSRRASIVLDVAVASVIGIGIGLLIGFGI